ncbi:MAG: hypothetical protein AAB508_02735 [Patescibacteria group bacterium]
MDSPTSIPPLPSSPAEALAKEGDPSLHSSQLATPPVPHPSKRLRLLSGLAILILGIFVGFFGSNLLNPSTNQSALAPTESLKDSSSFSQLTASPTPTIDPTANWKTYTDSKYGFEFKYPSEEKIENGVDKSSGKQYLLIGSANSLKITPEQQGLGNENPYAKITIEPLLIDGKQVSLGGHDIEKTKIVEQIPDATITTFLIIIPYPDKRDYSIMVNYRFNPGIVDKNIEETFDQILSTFKFL